MINIFICFILLNRLSCKNIEVNKIKNKSVTSKIISLYNQLLPPIHPDLFISVPLPHLTKKNQPFLWSQKQQNAFDKLKQSLCSAEVTSFYNPQAETKLIDDAGPAGLEAILSQKQPDGLHRPVSSGSRSLTGVETRYSQT